MPTSTTTAPTTTHDSGPDVDLDAAHDPDPDFDIDDGGQPDLDVDRPGDLDHRLGRDDHHAAATATTTSTTTPAPDPPAIQASPQQVAAGQ